MKKDGSQIQLIHAESSWNFSVKDQWIYVKNHKIKTDGSQVVDYPIKSNPHIIQDQIYYQEDNYENGTYGLYRMGLDGTKIQSLIDPQVQTYAWFDEDKIYYTTYDETNEKTTLWRLNPATKVATNVYEFNSTYYLIKEINNERIYRLSKDEKILSVSSFDGTFEKALMTLPMGDYFDWIKVSSNRIYINVHHENSIPTLFSLALDGSDLKEMTP